MKKKDSAVRWGLALFLTVGAILLFYDTLFGRRVLPSFGGQLLKALQPVLIGAVLAYLLAPVIDFIENLFFPEQMKKAHAEGRMTSRSARAVSLVVTWAIIGLLCYLLGHVLIPQLYRSVVQLVSSVEGYYNTISGWVEHLLESNPTVEVWVADQMDKFYESAAEWLKNQVFTRTQMLMIAVSGGVLSTLVFLKNLLVGMIVSVYFMATKERCAAHARKLAYSLFSEEAVYWVFRGSAKVDRIFSGFVRGKLLDSLIIGVLCFIGCSLLDMPYTPLVSVFVGVTNVIPFFGPFLGAIPSFFLILLVNPIQSLYFLLFVLALQQLDGNVIGPKILGEQHRPFQPVGHHCHSGGRQLLRRGGHVLRRAGVRLPLQPGGLPGGPAAGGEGPAGGNGALYGAPAGWSDAGDTGKRRKNRKKSLPFAACFLYNTALRGYR